MFLSPPNTFSRFNRYDRLTYPPNTNCEGKCVEDELYELEICDLSAM
jgi:hypothetical protein